MNIRKMYVIPSDFYESLIKKSKIVEDPILSAQIRTEDEKTKILKSKKKDNKAAALLSDISHKQLVLEEQRKKKIAEPMPITVVPIETEPAKKRGRPPKEPKESYFEVENQSGQGLLKRFYDFEPKGKKRAVINKCLRQTNSKLNSS